MDMLRGDGDKSIFEKSPGTGVGAGVGVGRFVTNDCWKRGGVFYLFFHNFDVLIRRQRGAFCRK